MGSSFKCNLCDRPMPPRVYEFHLKKSHTSEEVQSQIKKNEEEIANFVYVKPEDMPKSEITVTTCNCFCSKFDWGEVYPCNSCGVEYPAKAMPWHSKQAHGV